MKVKDLIRNIFVANIDLDAEIGISVPNSSDMRPYDGFAYGYEEAAKDAILCLCQNVLKQEQCHTSL